MTSETTERVICTKAQLGRLYDKKLTPVAYFRTNVPKVLPGSLQCVVGDLVYTCVYKVSPHSIWSGAYNVTLPCKVVRERTSNWNPALYAYDPAGIPQTFQCKVTDNQFFLNTSTEQAELIEPVLQANIRHARLEFIKKQWADQQAFLAENPDYVVAQRARDQERTAVLEERNRIDSKIKLGHALVEMKDASENLIRMLQDDNAIITMDTFSKLYQVIEKLSNVQRVTKSHIINTYNGKKLS